MFSYNTYLTYLTYHNLYIYRYFYKHAAETEILEHIEAAGGTFSETTNTKVSIVLQ